MIPPTMTAIEIREPGGPEVLRPVQRPVPDIGPREVLLRVVAAGVNRPEVAILARPFCWPERAATEFSGVAFIFT